MFEALITSVLVTLISVLLQIKRENDKDILILSLFVLIFLIVLTTLFITGNFY